MTQPEPDLNDLQDDDPRGLRDFAEREAQRARTAEQELHDLRTKEAFRSAGLDPNDKIHAAIINGYAGDIGGVGDFVTGLGLTSSNQPPPIPDDERAALERQSGLGSGDPAPHTDAEAAAKAELTRIAHTAARERWGKERFEDEFQAACRSAGIPIQELPIMETYAPGTKL